MSYLNSEIIHCINIKESLIVNQREKYDYLAATRGCNFAMVYTYYGRALKLIIGKIKKVEVNASWYSPRNNEINNRGTFNN